VAITSTFYDTSAGTPASLVDEVKWAAAHPAIGSSQYGVGGATDFKVTAHPTTPLTVNVAEGLAWGHGVVDESDSVIAVTCTAPAPGGTRWDMICVRRDWTPPVGGPTTVTKVEGGTSRLLPAGRENDPGTLDDQPVALVLWTYGSTQPTTIVDLRVWGGDGGLYAADDLVRAYMTRLGTVINIAGTIWQYTVDAEDAATWQRVGELDKISLYGTTNSLDSTPAAGQSGFLVQAGTAVGYSDNSGFGRVVFPRPFPNGLLTCLLINGDTSIDRSINRVITYGVAGLPWNTGRKDSVVFSLAYPNADGNYVAAANQLHRVNYIALGW
jgi:hypothetical protein